MPQRLHAPGNRRWGEVIIEGIIQLAGISAIVIIALIFLFLLREGLPMFLDIPLRQLFGIAVVSHRGQVRPGAAAVRLAVGDGRRRRHRRAAGHYHGHLSRRTGAALAARNSQAHHRGAGRHSLDRARLSRLGGAGAARAGARRAHRPHRLHRLADPGLHVPAHHHQHRRRCALRRTQGISRRLAGHRRHPVADHLARGGALPPAPAC